MEFYNVIIKRLYEELLIKKIKEFYGVDSLDCDILKVAHHGSETSSMPEFLNFFTCEYAVCSCNIASNTYYHPRYNTLVRLVNLDMTLYRTDVHGYIKITVSNTEEITFVTENTDVTSDAVWTGYFSDRTSKIAVKGASEE